METRSRRTPSARPVASTLTVKRSESPGATVPEFGASASHGAVQETCETSSGTGPRLRAHTDWAAVVGAAATAAGTSMSPAPVSLSRPVAARSWAVVSSASASSAGVSPGLACRRIAAQPAAIGVAMLVPLYVA